MQRVLAISIGMLFIALMLAGAQPATAQTGYMLIDLGGEMFGEALDVNELGQVVGYHNMVDVYGGNGFIWTAQDGLETLAQPWGYVSFANAINDHGQVVGTFGYGDGPPDDPDPLLRAFLWTKQDGMTELALLGNGDHSSARDINEQGQIVGWSTADVGSPWDWDLRQHAVMWQPNGAIVELAGADSEAIAINNSGQVIGHSQGRAFLWDSSTGLMDLGAIQVSDINDSGQIVGATNDRAFLWSEQDGMRDLGTLGGATSMAYGINNYGDVVGVSEVSSGPGHAFLWTEADGMIDLGLYGGDGSWANALNEYRQITGVVSTEMYWDSYSVMWTPTQAPNLLINPDFEEGKPPWKFFTNGEGSFTTTNDAYSGAQAAKVTIDVQGSNVQLYQYDISVEPNQHYRLHFAAYSSNGRDLSLYLHKHTSPYTSYGLNGYRVDLTEGWQTYTVDFTTTDFGPPTNDGRLRFWLAPFDANNMVYYIDYVFLQKITNGSPPPPMPPPILPPIPPEGYCKNSGTLGNIVTNPGFEEGKYPWYFYTNGTGGFALDDDKFYECYQSARITMNTPGSNVQLYQKNLELDPDTTYWVRLAAKASRARDISLYMHKHGAPYTNYGLNGADVPLTTDWQVYFVKFTTTNFADPVNDARLRIWLADGDNAGDKVWIDDVVVYDASIVPSDKDGAMALSADDAPLRQDATRNRRARVFEAGYFIDKNEHGRMAGGPVPNEADDSPSFCADASAKPAQLWPADGRWKEIEISGLPRNATVVIDSIYQDEQVDGNGGEDAGPDGRGIGTAVASVKAERLDGGNGRVYHIYFTADGGDAAVCRGEVLVATPFKRNTDAVDDEPLYDSTVHASGNEVEAHEEEREGLGANIFLPLIQHE